MQSDEKFSPKQCSCPLASGTCDKGGRLLQQLLALVSQDEEFSFVATELLRIAGNYFYADRGYIFKYEEENVSCAKELFSWQAPEAAEKLAALPILADGKFNGYRDLLLDSQPAILAKDQELSDPRIFPQEHADFQNSGVQSRLVCGIWLNERLYGFIGFDCVRSKQDFSSCQSDTVNSIVDIFRLAFKQSHQHVSLQESVLLQRQIMDNLSIPILLVDLNYHVRAANPTKKINVEIPLSKLIGTYCYDTVCKFGRPPDFCSVQETMQTQKPSRREFSFQDKRLISTAQPIFDRHGKMQYVLSVDIDVTEVTRQKEELKIAMEQAQAANHAKSYFLATVSHELRTPLNAVIGFSELLQNGKVDEVTQKDYLQSINFAGTALLNLINDVLDLSNLEADKTLIEPVITDVSDMINQVLSVFRLKTRQKQIDLIQETQLLKYPLYVDNLRLRQILLNLIGNAVKFTSQGGVTVRGKFTPTDDTYGCLEIQVADTGIGISTKNQGKIFEPFVHDSVIRGTRMYEGSGLGLTISRRLLDKMGGQIALTSEEGKGSIFTITLQVRYESNVLSGSNTLQKAEPESAQDVTGQSKLRMLLLDDVAIAMLARLNIESVTKSSAAAALETLSTDKNFDLILTDMWMPECNGTEFAKKVRTELNIKHIPIWAVTADTQVAGTDAEFFDGILYKPITQAALEEMISKAL